MNLIIKRGFTLLILLAGINYSAAAKLPAIRRYRTTPDRRA